MTSFRQIVANRRIARTGSFFALFLLSFPQQDA
jgi:hypothetical protein